MPDRSGTAAFAEFAAARQPALYRYAYLLTGDRGLAEDLVQESLIKLYVAWPRIRTRAGVEPYVRRVITNTAVSWWRRKAWRAERPNDDVPEQPEQPGQQGPGDDVDARVWLWAEILRLPVRQRAAVVLRYYEDLTEPQTAEILGCSVGTVKSQVAAALAKLRARLGDDLPLLDTAGSN
ncbi:SigE family RNA polymerase sigma factor [Kribbella sp. NPDC026611]|uniref:SigE family RNA polymerase sigma factor n=1 Tax=Kribbella sp. NPDC026611 TaxID=3154911 RepID=UPI003407DE18